MNIINTSLSFSSQALTYDKLSSRDYRTIHELSQILNFTQNSKIFGEENIHIHDKVNTIFLHLQQSQRNHTYMKVLSIITKYIDGIRKFLKKNYVQGASFYRQLFEGIFIAIIRETDGLVLPRINERVSL